MKEKQDIRILITGEKIHLDLMYHAIRAKTLARKQRVTETCLFLPLFTPLESCSPHFIIDGKFTIQVSLDITKIKDRYQEPHSGYLYSPKNKFLEKPDVVLFLDNVGEEKAFIQSIFKTNPVCIDLDLDLQFPRGLENEDVIEWFEYIEVLVKQRTERSLLFSPGCEEGMSDLTFLSKDVRIFIALSQFKAASHYSSELFFKSLREHQEKKGYLNNCTLQ